MPGQSSCLSRCDHAATSAIAGQSQWPPQGKFFGSAAMCTRGATLAPGALSLNTAPAPPGDTRRSLAARSQNDAGDSPVGTCDETAEKAASG